MAEESNIKTKNSASSGNGGSALIKTRETTRDIKVLDRARVLSDRTRDAYVRTKAESETSAAGSEQSATDYAEDKSLEAGERTAEEGAHQIKKQGKKAKDKIEQKIEKRLERRLEKQENENIDIKRTENGRTATRELSSKNSTSRTSSSNTSVSRTSASRNTAASARAKNTSIKTVDANAKTIKTTAKSSGKAAVKTTEKTIKTAERSVKTAEKTAKAAVKTAEKTAKAAEKTAEATAKASERAIAAAHKAAVAAGKAAVAAAKAIVAAVKSAASAAAKAISAIVAALGSAAPFIALAILFVAVSVLLTGDSVQNTDKDMSNAEIITDINAEWDRQIDWINSDGYEDILIEGSRASWVDVFSIFTAKAAEEVNGENWVKRDQISKIFWDMHSITYTKEIKIAGETAAQRPTTITLQTAEVTFLYINNGAVNRYTDITYQNDQDVNELLETYKDREITMSVTLTIHTKTIDEMADYYNFSDWQRDEAKSLTEDDFEEYWMERIYGVYGSDTDIVNVALTQVGNTGGYPYWAYTGYSSRVEWCACFVSWCAGQCGYVDQGLFPNTASPPYQAQFFRSEGHWLDGSAMPSPGMIIFFDWYNADFADHVGIVEKVENGYVYTIEGNSSDSVRQNTWAVGDSQIMGYGWIVE